MKTRLMHIGLVFLGLGLVGVPVGQAWFGGANIGASVSVGLVLAVLYAAIVRVANVWADGISNMRRTFAVVGTVAGIAGPVITALSTNLPAGSKGAIAAGFATALLASWKAAFGSGGTVAIPSSESVTVPLDQKKGAGAAVVLVLAGLLSGSAQAAGPQLGTCVDAGNTWCVQPATALGWQLNLKTGDVRNAAVMVGYSLVHQTGFAIGAGLYGGMGLAASGPNAPQLSLGVSLTNFGAILIGAQRAKFADGTSAYQGVVTLAGTLQFGGTPAYAGKAVQ